MSYNPDHQKIYQEDNYRICIAYFVLFQIILIYVQVLLSITLLEQRSDAVYAIFWAGCANFLPENAQTLLFCILLWKLAYFMGEYVSLKGGIAHLYWCFMLCCRKFWNIAFLEFFRMYFLYVLFSSPFLDFGPSDKRKKHCQRQSGPRVEFSLRKLLG